MAGGGAWSPASVSWSRRLLPQCLSRGIETSDLLPLWSLATLYWSLWRNSTMREKPKEGEECIQLWPLPLPCVSHVPVHCFLSQWCHMTLPTWGLVLSSLWKPAAALFLQPIGGGHRPPSRQHCCTLSFCVTILKQTFATDSNIFLRILRVVCLFIYLLLVKWWEQWLTGDYWCEISSGCSCSRRSSTPFYFLRQQEKKIF